MDHLKTLAYEAIKSRVDQLSLPELIEEVCSVSCNIFTSRQGLPARNITKLLTYDIHQISGIESYLRSAAPQRPVLRRGRKTLVLGEGTRLLLRGAPTLQGCHNVDTSKLAGYPYPRGLQ